MQKEGLWTLALALVVPLAACDDTTAPDPPLETGTLQGQIVNQDGDGLLGITVTASGPQDVDAETEVNGAYLFPDLTTGEYTVDITEAPEEITCPDSTKSVTVTDADTVDVDWICEGSQDTTQTSLRLTPGEILPL